MADPSSSHPSVPALTKEREAPTGVAAGGTEAGQPQPPEYTPAEVAPPGYAQPTPVVYYMPGSAQPVAFMPGSFQPITTVVSFNAL